MPLRLGPKSLVSTFWQENLTKNLRFKDAAIERNYIASKNSFQLLNFRLLCFILMILMTGNFLANPFSVNLFQWIYILPFISGAAFLMLGYLLITKRLRKKSQLAYSITVLIFVIGSGELSIHILGTSDWTPSLFWVLATHYQTACLLVIIARVSCFQCLFVLWIIQTYMWCLLYRVSGVKETFSTSMITYAVYLLALPAMSLCSEYEDRKIFFEVQKREANLRVFQNLIKEVLPSSIILFDKQKILFSNSKFKEIFGVEEENELIALLTAIEVSDIKIKGIHLKKKKNIIKVSQENGTQLKIRKRDYIEEEKKSLYNIIEEWRNKMEFNKISNSFVYFEAKFKSKSDSNRECTFAVQIGYTLWEGKASTMIIINDISAIKDYYKNLGEHKDHLLATVSHELRTPLNGILGMIDVSLENTKEELTKGNLEVMQKSGKLLLNMINDILDYSLISKNKLRLNISIVDIVKLVEETIKIVELQAKMKGINLLFEQNVQNPLVKTDSNRLRQIILNLVGNAIKFTSCGSVTVRVKEIRSNDILNRKFEFEESSSGELIQSLKDENSSQDDDILEEDTIRAYQIEFEDTGIGIAKEDQKGIFRLFGRLHQVNKNINQNGVGLGLAISDQLVRALNRKTVPPKGISLKSEPGKGSTFLFHLHLLSTHSNEISSSPKLNVQADTLVYRSSTFLDLSRKNETSTVNKIPRSLDTKKEIKLLAVDDDQINLIVIRNYISTTHIADKSFTLLTANNGKEAIEIVKSEAIKGAYFNTFLMDCNMPIMDGYEASRILRDMMFKGEIPEASIIAITANAANADKQNCFRNGMDYFLSKPLKKTDLIEMIEKSLKDKEKGLRSFQLKV